MYKYISTQAVAFSDEKNSEIKYTLKIKPCYIKVQLSSLFTILESMTSMFI